MTWFWKKVSPTLQMDGYEEDWREVEVGEGERDAL